ncbi:hypothetical protein XENTR_v10022426 [Xenopus tropicalis]|nr:hypothetical protein XENTR_v10022426 [Xenopus tropicalis]
MTVPREAEEDVGQCHMTVPREAEEDVGQYHMTVPREAEEDVGQCHMTVPREAEEDVASQVGPIQVYGLITQTVSLAPTEHLAQPVEEVTWHYISNGTRYRLADYRNQRLSIRHSQFSQRLDADNSGTRLWIRELRSEDTGSYTAFITLNGTTHTVDLSFTLTVYEPVPTPDIKMEMEQISPDWCNFTLHCSAPTNPSALSYSWMYRHKGRYQPYPNGTTIRVSLQPESWDGEYLCLVQNPVGQNYVSITAREICNGTLTTKVINGGYNLRQTTIM